MLYASFLFLTFLFLLFFYLGTGRNKKVLYSSMLWIAIPSVLAGLNYFQITDTWPPRFLIILVGNILFITYSCTKLKEIKLNYTYSLLIHSLRIMIEIVLYFLFTMTKVPQIMTFIGLNYDIVFGITALILLLLHFLLKIKPSKKVLIIWNCIGLMFLFTIVMIAILSSPLPFQQISFDQPNIAVLEFPFVLLPSFVVPIVFLTHILSIKQLIKNPT